MPTVPLPERPNLEQLRRRARELQRGVRDGDPAALTRAGLTAADPRYPLHRAQLALARRHGFPSWPRLHAAVEAIAARTWVPSPPMEGEPAAYRFLRLACLDYDDDRPGRPGEAAVLLATDPALPTSDPGVAAACADAPALRAHLAADPGSAVRPTGPHGWSPLMYLAYSRAPAPAAAVLSAAELLLDAGADPDDGRFFRGLPTPFTVLTGVFGGGELDQPPHPSMRPLARLLLDRGAEPNDAQTLYNRQFRLDDDFLEVLFEFGLGRGEGGPWRRLLPDLLDPPPVLVRGLLEWAVVHDQRRRVELLARNGVDVVRALGTGRTPVEEALVNGHGELADLLRDLGGGAPRLDPVDVFVTAALAGDADAVRRTPAAVVAAARWARPSLIGWAVAQHRLDAVELLVASGFDVNALGRGDVPIEQPWETALHTAAQQGDGDLVRRLLGLGADPSIPDRRFGGTAADWARHFGHDDLVPMLEG